ncbi:FxsA family protein [Primorskyibacter sp. S187A]|uniref:FxsA family protein n=1 Tax=Primorskyibacter sp. S187A TaxID=3415130 RepID=UPI003C7AA84A
MPLLLAFLLVPLIEIALFIQIGGVIGLWWTLAIVILTAVAGATLVRQQGRGVLGQVQSSFNELRDPSQPLAEGAMILFSGALLLTPGFFTDAIGFALLIPGVRAALFNRIKARMTVMSSGFQNQANPPRNPHPADDIVEGEFEVEPEAPPKQDGPSGWTRH